jgi:hypothetical protein
LGILQGVRKYVLYRGQKGENKASEPKNRTQGPKISKINFHTKKIKTSRHLKNAC